MLLVGEMERDDFADSVVAILLGPLIVFPKSSAARFSCERVSNWSSLGEDAMTTADKFAMITAEKFVATAWRVNKRIEFAQSRPYDLTTTLDLNNNRTHIKTHCIFIYCFCDLAICSRNFLFA
jgi:hypothetical protein